MVDEILIEQRIAEQAQRVRDMARSGDRDGLRAALAQMAELKATRSPVQVYRIEREKGLA